MGRTLTLPSWEIRLLPGASQISARRGRVPDNLLTFSVVRRTHSFHGLLWRKNHSTMSCYLRFRMSITLRAFQNLYFSDRSHLNRNGREIRKVCPKFALLAFKILWNFETPFWSFYYISGTHSKVPRSIFSIKQSKRPSTNRKTSTLGRLTGKSENATHPKWKYDRPAKPKNVWICTPSDHRFIKTPWKKSALMSKKEVCSAE